MAISTKDFTTLVNNMVTSIQGATTVLVDFTIGSILRSLVEATASVVLWLESLILQVLAITRAATSTGADLDSWVADYGVTRIAAVAASGNVLFTRFNTAGSVTILLGSKVQTADGTQQYQVIADVTNIAYNAGLGGYVMNAAVASVTVKVQALTAAAAGNAASGVIIVIVGTIPGVDRVTNVAQFTTGADAQSDAALRAQFVNYIASLSKATKGALAYAITSVQLGLKYVIIENQTFSGLAQNGYFYAIVDDGTGSPPAPLLTAIIASVDAVRPACSFFGIFAPLLQTVNVTLTVTVSSGYTGATVRALVQTAIQNYINTTTFGQTIPLSQISYLAYNASLGVANVTAVTLNSGVIDITSTFQTLSKFGTVTVS